MRYRSASKLSAADIGARVTVRRRLAEGGQSDVIGTLEAVDEHGVTVRDRHGALVTIAGAEITAARVHGNRPGTAGV